MNEIIADTPLRHVTILCEEPGLHATFSRFGAGQDGADLHVHRSHWDVFYVLSGTLSLKRRGGTADTAGPGTIVAVPPNVAHGFANASPDTPVSYLNFHAPGTGFATYMRGLRDGARVPFDQHEPPNAPDPAEPIFTSSLTLPHLSVNAESTLPLRCTYTNGTWLTGVTELPPGALLITAHI